MIVGNQNTKQMYKARTNVSSNSYSQVMPLTIVKHEHKTHPDSCVCVIALAPVRMEWTLATATSCCEGSRGRMQIRILVINEAVFPLVINFHRSATS